VHEALDVISTGKGTDVAQDSNKMDQGFGSLFEEDYLIRNLGQIAHDPEVALTELVANAWDAGASLVDIAIPNALNGNLVVEDDGHGMSSAQFKGRWMKLSYDRVKHQSQDVEFPPERAGWVRRAYGHNGVGRHGMLCFADVYEVQTWRDDKGTSFVVSTHSQATPFKIDSEVPLKRAGHGTKLIAKVERHLPDPDRIRDILSARFLHDPQFVVRVNGASIALPEHTGLVEKATLEIAAGKSIEAFVVDTTRGAKSTLYQGVAFWVNGRLVGTPSWVVGNAAVLDGRSRFAKRYTIVVRCGPEWIGDIEPDWARFRPTNAVRAMNSAVAAYAAQVFAKLSEEFVDDSSHDALVRNRESFKNLSTLARIEVASFTQELVKRNPGINAETLAIAVEAVINLEKSRSGTTLLEKLTRLEEADVEGLDRLLGQWSVRDALSVLDEIDMRLSVIEAIDKLAGDPATDELHTLHPLVTQARWLFGPEFDSHEYTSNVTLRTVASKILGQNVEASAFLNPKQRPDIVVLADATFSIVGTEGYDSFDTMLTRIQNVLIIELKKGKSSIGRPEMSQADDYVQDFLQSGAMDGTPLIRAFVVGHQISSKTTKEKLISEEGVIRGKVVATTYGQLTRTASQRLFKLREKIPSRFEQVSGADLMSRVMQTPSQAGFNLGEQATSPNNTNQSEIVA
jgi:hypothetical protein